MSISIRTATEDDLDAIYKIETDSSPSPWSYAGIAAELTYPFSRVYIAEFNGTIAGFAVVWNVGGDIQLNNLAVKKDYRRKGIARKLVEHISERINSKIEGRIILEVREKNITARSFYQAIGFLENGLRKNYYQDDHAILMERPIRTA